MDIEKFWKEYTSKPVLDSYDLIKETFENELPDEFIEECDVI